MESAQRSAILLRISAIVLLVATAVMLAFALHPLFVTQPRGAPAISVKSVLLPAIGGALPLLGLSALLWGLGSLLGRPVPAGFPVQALNQMSDSLDQIRSAVASLPSAVLNATRTNVARIEEPVVRPAPMPAETSQAIGKMIALLEEIRELSMLDEQGKHARLRAHAAGKKVQILAEAANFVRHREWGKADRLLQSVEVDFPDDEEAAKLRRDLDAGRAKVLQDEAVAKVKARVEDMMAIGSWDQAVQTASQFAADFPSNADGQYLLARVNRERDLFRESTVHRLYDEIKECIDRRQWRRGLAAAQRMLERFPDHKRSAKIRGQLATIQSNAEIEERQELENRIQELIRSKRYAEAIELAEDLLDRFPASPQAESLEEMLPKMREKAFEQDIESSVMGNE